jgi:small multidrug resistance family-3 protein
MAIKTVLLFGATAIAEIVGCYLPYLWLQGRAGAWVMLPAALSLVVFVWLLNLHPSAAGRTYAAYGCIYVAIALLWLWVVDGIRPDRWDVLGGTLALAGMAEIAFAPRTV